MIDNTRHYEQEIRQPIDVCQQMRLDAIGADRHDRSLGAAAHGSREMEQRACAIAARKNEPAEWRKFGFQPINPFLEALHIGVGDRDLRDTLGNFLRGVRQPRADRKQILLQLLEESGNIARELTLCAHRAKTRVQLVDIAVRRYARIRLRDARAAEQRCAAAITGARINLHGRQYT